MNGRSLLYLFMILVCPAVAVAQEPEGEDGARKGQDSASFNGWHDLSFDTYAWIPITQFSDLALQEIIVKGNGMINSNAVNLSFSAAALRNRFIAEELKQAVAEDLAATNAFEYTIDAEAGYRFVAPKFFFHSPSLLSFNMKIGSVQQSTFTEDLFKVSFFGNADYAGQTADFSGSRDLQYNYRQLRLGMQKQFLHKANQWETGIGISYISAIKGQEILLHEATLFTEENGEYLDADYNMEYHKADTSNNGSLQTDGHGFAADLLLSYLLHNGKSRLTFLINDAGIIAWNKHSLLYTADSSVHFEGVEVNDFLTQSDSTIFQFNGDTLLKKTGATVHNGAFTTALALRFSLAYFQKWSDRWVTVAGITYRPLPDLMPLIFIQPQYVITGWLTAGCSFAYGGTAGFGLGLTGAVNLQEKFRFTIASQNILGIIMSAQTTSTSLFLQASYRF